MAEALDVWVNGQPAGVLFREDQTLILRYADHAEADAFVSLTMPTRSRDYSHNRLHPIFEMHLPEGYLLALLKRHFSKLTATDDFGLLSLLSGSVHGRLQYAAQPQPASDLSLSDILHGNHPGLFDELVQRFALQSPLSGVQPKVLARLNNKATLRLDEYIVKAWGADYPQLALNEYWCMKAVARAGIPVPEFFCSDDTSLFIMKRFDLPEQAAPLGFEDFCVLQARSRDDKYSGSYEQMARSLGLFVSPAFKAAAYQQLFKMLVMNNYLQNGDAHLKNFGVLYEHTGKVWLAPAYDVVSTTAYIRNDASALTLLGSRKWWAREHLLRFGIHHCELTQKQANTLLDECINALHATAAELTPVLDAATDNAQQQVLGHLHQLMLAAI